LPRWCRIRDTWRRRYERQVFAHAWSNEMIDASTIYWITRLDTINIFLGVLACLVGLGTIVCIEIALNAPESVAHRFNKWAVILLFSSAILWLGVVFTPTTKEAAAMYALPAIVNDQVVREEAGELYGLAKRWLERQVPAEGADQHE